MRLYELTNQYKEIERMEDLDEQTMLDTLEKEGFVATVLDKDGDKELVTISELVANAVKEAKK